MTERKGVGLLEERRLAVEATRKNYYESVLSRAQQVAEQMRVEGIGSVTFSFGATAYRLTVSAANVMQAERLGMPPADPSCGWRRLYHARASLVDLSAAIRALDAVLAGAVEDWSPVLAPPRVPVRSSWFRRVWNRLVALFRRAS